MRIDVNGTRLWFDVDGPALVPDGSGMRQRPAVVLVHGGPGSFDHSSLKPDFGRLANRSGLPLRAGLEFGFAGRMDSDDGALARFAADPDNPAVTFGSFDQAGRPEVLYEMLWGLPRLAG